MRFASSCTLDGFLSVWENPCVPMLCGEAPVVGLATSISAKKSASEWTDYRDSANSNFPLWWSTLPHWRTCALPRYQGGDARGEGAEAFR